MWCWKIVDSIINEIDADRGFTHSGRKLAAVGCVLCWGLIYATLNLIVKKTRLFTHLKDKYPKRIDKWIAIISAVVVICLVAILIVGDIIYNVRIGRGE